MPVAIRDANPGDAKIIVAYNTAMALETEGRQLDASLIAAGVQAVLEDEHKGRYWVAEQDGHLVGQIMITHEWSDWRNGVLWWISSVYVAEPSRRRGVFSALYRHVEALARQDPGCCGILLYVEHENQRAQQTYLALGMLKPGYDVMEVDFRKEAIQEQESSNA